MYRHGQYTPMGLYSINYKVSDKGEIHIPNPVKFDGDDYLVPSIETSKSMLLTDEQICVKCACAYANHKVPNQSCPYQRREKCPIFRAGKFVAQAQYVQDAELFGADLKALEEAHQIALWTARIQGIKEVVEWVRRQHCYTAEELKVRLEAKLKEWGL